MLRGTFVNYISVKFYFIAFVVLFTLIAGLKGEMMTSKYLIYQNKSPTVPAVIGSTEVSSLTECASLCTANLQCKSFSVDCLKLPLAKQICHQQSTEVTTVADLVDSELCYIQRESLSVFVSATTEAPTTTEALTTTVVPTTTVAATTTETPTTVAQTTTSAPTTTVVQTTTLAPPPPTTTVVPTSTIAQSTATVIDIVYGAKDMCQGGSNQDFLVLTPEGVYVYDTVHDLTLGACNGPINFTTIFKGYPSIPTISSVSGILIFQTSNIELYAEGTVYKWQIENGKLNNVLGMNSYFDHLGTTALDSVEVFWAAHRDFTSAERHFYLGADMFFMKSSQHGTSQFNKTEKVLDQNNNDMNPWSDIPTDTIAVTGYGSDPKKNYALIDSAGNVYKYQLDHSVDNRNPTKSLTLQGQLQF